MTTRKALLALLAVLAIAAAACGGADGGDAATTPPTETTETESPSDTPSEGECPEATGDTPTATATDFEWASPEGAVASGECVHLESFGQAPHTFTVDGTDVDEELSPGDTVDVPIDLDPGDYAFRCRFHGQMQGTLTVT